MISLDLRFSREPFEIYDYEYDIAKKRLRRLAGQVPPHINTLLMMLLLQLV
jgi:hypothetical protein